MKNSCHLHMVRYYFNKPMSSFIGWFRQAQPARQLKKSLLLFLLALCLLTFSSCSESPWDTTTDVSTESYFPQFEFIGEQYISFPVNTLAEFIDSGVIATINGQEISYGTIEDTVKVDSVGLYSIAYYAFNEHDILGFTYRYIAITDTIEFAHELEGNYVGGSRFGTAEMKVKKLGYGFYSCSDVMGYPNAEMEGVIVDMGRNNLQVLPGEGDFGDFDATYGTHTLSSMFWNLRLLDAEYDGLTIQTGWSKNEDN